MHTAHAHQGRLERMFPVLLRSAVSQCINQQNRKEGWLHHQKATDRLGRRLSDAAKFSELLSLPHLRTEIIELLPANGRSYDDEMMCFVGLCPVLSFRATLGGGQVRMVG